jgi:hypothetical protein
VATGCQAGLPSPSRLCVSLIALVPSALITRISPSPGRSAGRTLHTSKRTNAILRPSGDQVGLLSGTRLWVTRARLPLAIRPSTRPLRALLRDRRPEPVALARPFGLPPGLPEMPFGKRPDPSLRTTMNPSSSKRRVSSRVFAGLCTAPAESDKDGQDSSSAAADLASAPSRAAIKLALRSGCSLCAPDDVESP